MGSTVRALVSWAVVAACGFGSVCAAATRPLTDAGLGALPGWQGTTVFSVSLILPPPLPPREFNVDVDFAVFAPGDYSNSALLGLPADPSGGGHFVYAYQVIKNSGNVSISTLSVGFDDRAPQGDDIDDAELPENIGFLTGFSDPAADPLSTHFNPDDLPATTKTSAVYEFSLAGVDDATDILIYTSPFGPEMDRASIMGGAVVNFQALPSPNAVPEPGTLTLGILGMVMFMARRMWRRRRYC